MNESLQATLGINTTPFMEGLKNVGTKTRYTLMKISDDVKDKLTSAFGAGAVVAGASVMINKALEMADSVGNMSEALDVSTDFLQGFRYAAGQAGASAEDAGKAIEKLAVKIGESKQGNDEALAVFRKLNVALLDGSGRAKTTEEIFFDVVDALENITDSSVRTAVEMELLGKVGPKMAAMLKQGTDEIRKQIQEAPKLAKDEIEELKAMGDELQRSSDKMTVYAGRFIWAWRKIGQGVVGELKRIDASAVEMAGVTKQSVEKSGLTDLEKKLESLSNAHQKMMRQSKGETKILGKQETEQMVAAGKTVAEIFEKINASERSAAENLKRAQNDQIRLADEYVAATGDAVKQSQIQLQLANAAKDANEARLQLEKQVTDQKKLQNDIGNAENELRNKKFKDLGPQTVGDLANMDVSKKDAWTRDFWNNQKRLAQGAQFAEDMAQQANDRGDVGSAKKWREEALKRRGQIQSLPEDVRNPFRWDVERLKAMKDQAENLKKIIEQNETGIKVIPVNPPSTGAK